ncbi:MAG TPA: folylpolyglutamate synthase/dihydrofolate synthase family protein [Dongiaceae bacterium]|nr:folylpolyglutamate synthase/dihydrofolate synthase family protein [Dongiaceae bacterium]
MSYEEGMRRLDALESLGIQPGLERITALLARLGDPHRGLRSVVVAGTNGKGSVTAFLAAILAEAGFEPGLYTSPHLSRFEERVRVGDREITRAEVAILAADVMDAVNRMRRDGGPTPTYFEATTALAFLHFRRCRVPIALLEVGMGGRFDATNVVDPVASAITPVSLDHTQYLGGTVAEIAFQKAGIMRAGVPTVVGRQTPEGMRVLREEAARIGAPLLESAHCAVSPRRAPSGTPLDPPVFDLVVPPDARYAELAPALRGEHQIDNAVVALLLARSLRTRGFAAVDDDAIARGLRRARWPGRLQLVEAARDAPGGPDLLLDGAHNPAGCAILANYLVQHQSARRRVLLFAAMRDKPAAEMLRALRPAADALVLTSLAPPRGAVPGELAAAARAAGFAPEVIADRTEALARARAAAGPGGLVVVCGSLYLVGDVLSAGVPGEPAGGVSGSTGGRNPSRSIRPQERWRQR